MTDRTRRTLLFVCFVVLTAVSAVRIVLTYDAFFQTEDEPYHVACGMYWLAGEYPTGCLDQPPLVRAAIGFSLRQGGATLARFSGAMVTEGSAILRTGQGYEHNLFRSRVAILPFFLLASLMVWVWADRLFGPWAALGAAVLFENVPPVLGHAGLATVDMGMTAALSLALFALVRWLDRGTLRSAVFFGATAGFAIAIKHSAVPFIAAATVLILSARAIERRRVFPERGRARMRSVGHAVAAVLLGLGVVGASYRFASTPLLKARDRPHRIAKIVRLQRFSPRVQDAFNRAVEHPWPAAGWVAGLSMVDQHNNEGHLAYFMGEVRRFGWIWFFPALILLKTPIAFLVAAALGLFFLFRDRHREALWPRLAPVLGAIAVLIVGSTAHINIGLRHVLPIYPLLAIVGGYGLARTASAFRSPLGALLSLALVAWVFGVSFRAHPDYLAYFNLGAGDHLERITADSDLDWGQDVKPLLGRLRRRGVTSLSYRCLGCRFMTQMGLPPLPEFPERLEVLRPYTPVTGWVAIDEWALKVDGANHRDPKRFGNAFDWLARYPYERVGRSMRLYRVPEDAPRWEAP